MERSREKLETSEIISTALYQKQFIGLDAI